jgi:anti-anti-sigma factor
LNITLSNLSGTVLRVELEGRLDAAGADAIGLRFTAATTAPGRSVMVSLVGVSFVASLGIRLLISSARALARKGPMMVLYGANDSVGSVLHDAGIDQLIPCVGSEADALARLAG